MVSLTSIEVTVFLVSLVLKGLIYWKYDCYLSQMYSILIANSSLYLFPTILPFFERCAMHVYIVYSIETRIQSSNPFTWSLEHNIFSTSLCTTALTAFSAGNAFSSLYICSCLVGGVGFGWGSSPPLPTSLVLGGWSVCGRWLVEAASPGLSQADWTLGLRQAHTCGESVIKAHRVNQPSHPHTHTHTTVVTKSIFNRLSSFKPFNKSTLVSSIISKRNFDII